MTFKAWSYDASTDHIGWHTFTVEGLLSKIATETLHRLYGGFHLPPSTFHVMLDRVVRTGLVSSESQAIAEAWGEWWKDHLESTAINGPDFRPPEPPRDDEIIDALKAQIAAWTAKREAVAA